MKNLYLVRGLPGSGKSTLAKMIGDSYFEADMYFMEDGIYNFDPAGLKDAHEWCRKSTETAMRRGEDKVIVSNTFTQEWEMKAYYELAEKYGYRVHSIIVENVHEGKNVHNVPEDKINEMKKRFIVRL